MVLWVPYLRTQAVLLITRLPLCSLLMIMRIMSRSAIRICTYTSTVVAGIYCRFKGRCEWPVDDNRRKVASREWVWVCGLVSRLQQAGAA
jgi:hypothetical protein